MSDSPIHVPLGAIDQSARRALTRSNIGAVVASASRQDHEQSWTAAVVLDLIGGSR